MLSGEDRPPCEWCVQNLSNDRIQKYTELIEDNDTVIPNCGSQQCMVACGPHTSRADGFIVKGKNKKGRALKRKQKKEEKERKRQKLNPTS